MVMMVNGSLFFLHFIIITILIVAVYVEEFDGLLRSCIQRYPGITITLFHLDEESIKLIMEARITQLLIFVFLFLFVFWC